MNGAVSSGQTRGVCDGWWLLLSMQLNTIDFVTIASTGNATDFGDLITMQENASFKSNSIISGLIRGW